MIANTNVFYVSRCKRGVEIDFDTNSGSFQFIKLGKIPVPQQ